MEPTKNLCAQIPESLHAKIREQQEAKGQTLSQYMTAILTEHFEKEEIKRMDKVTRTIAFQVPEEMFQEMKQYLKKHNLKQKDFIMGLIQQALTDDADTASLESKE